MGYIWALFVLQFHVARHALTGGKLLAYFIVGFVATGAIVFAIGLGWLFHEAGKGWLSEQSRPITLLAFNLLMLVYAMGWFWGLVMEVQRSDVIDVRKMLHFPVPLSVVNAINFLVSLVGLTTLFYVCGAAGLCVGIWRATGAGLPAYVLAAGSFYFLSASWAYYLRGLLVVWMEDKRRRRLLLTVLPFFFMTVGFAPMMLTNLLVEDRSTEAVAAWLSAPAQLIWIERSSFLHPGGQLSLAMASILTGEGPYWIPLSALWGLGALGYFLGYRTTLHYSHGLGGERSGGALPTGEKRSPWTARKLPLLHEETAALAQAILLNFSRHPQVRTMLLAPVGLVILLAAASSRSFVFGQELGLPVVAIVWPFLMFGGVFFNLFGMDQRGFRTLLLLPTPRHRILLAYHLALVPLAGGMGLCFALFGSWYFGLGAETTFVSVVQIVQLFLNFSLVGSFVSIFAPMAVGRNMMRKQQGRVLLVALLMPLVVSVLVMPTALCLFIDGFASRWGLVDFPVAPLLSLALVGITVVAYPFFLRQAGDLLMVREQRILARLLNTAE
jgi:ABC-2 type transport system permease protein